MLGIPADVCVSLCVCVYLCVTPAGPDRLGPWRVGRGQTLGINARLPGKASLRVSSKSPPSLCIGSESPLRVSFESRAAPVEVDGWLVVGRPGPDSRLGAGLAGASPGPGRLTRGGVAARGRRGRGDHGAARIKVAWRRRRRRASRFVDSEKSNGPTRYRQALKNKCHCPTTRT